MSNIITLANNSNMDIHISNGTISVFITVLGLSGTRLAKTDDEKKVVSMDIRKRSIKMRDW